MASQFNVTASEAKKEARNIHVNDVADGDTSKIIEEVESIVYADTKAH